LANFCSSIEFTAEAYRLRRILAKSPATIGYLKTNADSWTENSQETLELRLGTNFPKNTHAVEDFYIEENSNSQTLVAFNGLSTLLSRSNPPAQMGSSRPIYNGH